MTTETGSATDSAASEVQVCDAPGCVEPAVRRWEPPASLQLDEAAGIPLCGAHWEELGESVRTAGRVR